MLMFAETHEICKHYRAPGQLGPSSWPLGRQRRTHSLIVVGWFKAMQRIATLAQYKIAKARAPGTISAQRGGYIVVIVFEPKQEIPA
jgi:hypothetical protein